MLGRAKKIGREDQERRAAVRKYKITEHYNKQVEVNNNMRILLLASAYNGLSQRAHVELEDLGHEVSVSFAISPDEIREAVTYFEPELVICPFLKEKIPSDVWKHKTCIIIHPGIKGDRGASSLDWAISEEFEEWGVTALEAAEEMDAGDIWATRNFAMRKAGKCSIYRREVTQAAMAVIHETVEKFTSKKFTPEPLDYSNKDIKGVLRPTMKQKDRAIDWSEDETDTIVKKINAADSCPGVLDEINGAKYFLFGAHKESMLKGSTPGAIIAKRHGAICRATVDGAVWISHLKRKVEKNQSIFKRLTSSKAPVFKLPATMVLGKEVAAVKESPIHPLFMSSEETFKEIWYEEKNDVGYLHFDFHNGAMSTEQCRLLRESFRAARQRLTKVIVLMGGTDFWSNGIHLNVIEAASSPSNESWQNINAIDDLILDIITTESHLIVAALWGNTGAGGAMMPLAADRIVARQGCVMNPHYIGMGLYGSEYWTYLLPKRVGYARALELTQRPLPVGMVKAKAMGMVDDVLSDEYEEFKTEVTVIAEEMAQNSEQFDMSLDAKAERRSLDETVKPLAEYREAELKRMQLNFAGQMTYGAVTYSEARHNFVHKVKLTETPKYLAKHKNFNLDDFKELKQA